MFQLISQDDLEFAQSMEFASLWFLYNLQAIQKHLVKSRNYQMIISWLLYRPVQVTMLDCLLQIIQQIKKAKQGDHESTSKSV